MTAIVRSWVIVAVAIGLCQAQSGPARGPQFEVASIKLSPTPPTNRAFTMSDARVELGSIPLKYLIQLAYAVEPYQTEGPDWMATTRFDLVAKMPAGATKDQIPDMLRSLLADRFGLVMHREPKEQQVYALLIGKDGPKLKDAAPDNKLDTSFLDGRSVMQKNGADEGDGFWTISFERSNPGGGNVFDAPRITMPEFARNLMPYVEFPVVDMTGLKGPYHARLDVPRTLAALRMRESIPRAAAEGAPDPDGGLTIFGSIQKLGLVLGKRKAPVDHIVVDHIEKAPTEN